MAIYITGDTHRNFHDVTMFAMRNNTRRSDVLVILGDAGINYYADESDIALKRNLHKLPLTLFCVHGNHEIRPKTIDTYEETERFGGIVYYEKEFPNLLFAKDGEIYDFNGRKVIVIGGAYSIDKAYRTEGVSWWADEQPSDEIKARVERKLDSVNWKVDAVFSHTCPFKYIPRECFLESFDQKSVDQSTELWLDKIEKKLDYKEFYCGHWHTDKRDANILFFFRQFREIFRTPFETSVDKPIYFVNNRVKCLICGDIVEYFHDNEESNYGGVIYCECGEIALDPSAQYYRIIGNTKHYSDLSERNV